MAKIAFDIKYRPEIESGKYKVVTSTNNPVRIVCWDRVAQEGQSKDLKLCVLITDEIGGESCYYYLLNGKPWLDNRVGDLFILTDEPELTEFEKAYLRSKHHVEPEDGLPEFLFNNKVRENAQKLLDVARKQLQTEIDAEIDKAYKNSDAVQYRRGKEYALKDMPHWRRMCAGVAGNGDGRNAYLIRDRFGVYSLSSVIACDYDYLVLAELDKLPKM